MLKVQFWNKETLHKVTLEHRQLSGQHTGLRTAARMAYQAKIFARKTSAEEKLRKCLLKL